MQFKIPSRRELQEKTENGNHLFEVVSFFAGGGGSSTGYRMAGGKVLAVNEFIQEAVNSYRANWPTTEIIASDIRKTEAATILQTIGKACGELDLLDGSPPCSGFSMSGKRSKNWGKTKKYSDKAQENVEDLFFDYIRMIEGIQPKVFIAENVAGLIAGSAKGYFNMILRGLRGAGYHVECQVLDAKWLGVPQTRTRTIFVGVRNDLMKDEYKGKLHPKPFGPPITLEVALDGLVFDERDREEQYMNPETKMYQRLCKLREGESHEVNFNLVKSHRKKPCGCVMATPDSTPKHWDNRRFSVKELKRIMTIPDDYELTGSIDQRKERLGRMVPPFMMKAIAENVLSLGVLK